MSDAKLVVGQATERPGTPAAAGWRVLLWTGLGFLVVGALDIALVWYPARFGVPEFEFASVAASLNSLPVATMGVALVVAGVSGARVTWMAWLAFVVSVVACLLLVIGGVLFALTVPLALQADLEDLVLLGLKKQSVKGAVQVVVYLMVYVMLSRAAYRSARLA